MVGGFYGKEGRVVFIFFFVKEIFFFSLDGGKMEILFGSRKVRKERGKFILMVDGEVWFKY